MIKILMTATALEKKKKKNVENISCILRAESVAMIEINRV